MKIIYVPEVFFSLKKRKKHVYDKHIITGKSTVISNFG